MSESEGPQFEAHDRDVLAKARSIMSETESPNLKQTLYYNLQSRIPRIGEEVK